MTEFAYIREENVYRLANPVSKTMASLHCGCTSRRLKHALADDNLGGLQVKQRVGCCQVDTTTTRARSLSTSETDGVSDSNLGPNCVCNPCECATLKQRCTC